MVELPLMLFFDRVTFSKSLEIIRSYDFLGSQMSA
jgi:chemotaxis protein CheC